MAPPMFYLLNGNPACGATAIWPDSQENAQDLTGRMNSRNG
ncbi:hypothetical protein [Chlorobium sp.]